MEKRDTENEFVTAFWKLYAVKPIEKISIHQLCLTVGYNRATFYNHYHNIYDLLDCAVNSILVVAKAKIGSIKNPNDLFQGNIIETIIIASFVQKSEYIMLLFKRQNHLILGKKIKEEIFHFIKDRNRDKTKNYEMIELLLEYQISAVLGVISYCYQQGKSLSEDEILNKIYYISTKGVLNVLKEEIK